MLRTICGFTWTIIQPEVEQHWENWLCVLGGLVLLFIVAVPFGLVWDYFQSKAQSREAAERDERRAEMEAREEALRKAKLERETRQTRAAIDAIQALDRDAVLGRLGGGAGGAISLNTAVDEGLVEVTRLEGRDLRESVVGLSPRPGGVNRRICIPLGATLVSSGRHQTMVVRDDTLIELDDDNKLIDVPVSCINFFKSVPTSRDAFDRIGDADPLLKAVLAIASAAQVDSFVTQLAVWKVTDGVNPSMVSIKERVAFDMVVRRPTKSELQITDEILKKAQEVTGQEIPKPKMPDNVDLNELMSLMRKLKKR